MRGITSRRRRTGVVAGMLLVATVLGACGAGDEGPTSYPKGTIAAIMAADERFDTLMQIVEVEAPRVFISSFTTTVLPDGRRIDITWFAPTDEAVEALPPDTLDELRDDDNVSDLKAVLDHHTILTAHSLSDLMSIARSGDGVVEDITGQPIRLTLVDGVLHVDEAAVIDGDIEAENGVIHVVDALMIPDSVRAP
jgi:transforming growth factor-beta-induced protein